MSSAAMERSFNQIYSIEGLEIDPGRGCVVRNGEELHLRRKSFQVLVYLLERRERLVSKDELFGALWSDTAVTDDVLVQCIKEVRRALGDDPHSPRFIKTVPRSGYRFIGPVATNGCTGSYTEEITRFEFEIEEEADGLRADAARPAPLSLPGRRSWRRRAVITGGVAVACILGSFLYFGVLQPGPAADIRLPQIAGRETVAVMFFHNASGDKELDWLREGLADMLITNLSRSEKLTVLSRQQLSALLERTGRYRGDAAVGLDAAMDLANKSGAQTIVSGSFARVGEKVRIDVQIQDAANASLRAAESLTVESLDDILSQIDILSLKLARHLSADVPAAADQGLATVMTDDLEAYRLYSLGVAKANALENRDAVELLQRATALDPEFAMAHARLGYAYAVTWGQPDEGKPHLERAFSLSARTTERDRRNIAAWYAIANRDYEAAIQAYREIVRQQPLETEGYWRLGRLLAGEARTDEAIDVLRKGIAVDPESKNLFNSLGTVLSSLGKHSEAISAHQRYVALAPNEPNAYDSLGLTYQWAGDYDRARENFERALEINPSFEVAVIHLAHCLTRVGKYRSAIDAAERYLQLVRSTGEKARALDLLSYIHLQLGDVNKAERVAEQWHALGLNAAPWGPYQVAIEKKQTDRARKLEASLFLNTEGSDRGARGNSRFLLYFKGAVALNNGRSEEALGFFREALSHRPPTWHHDDFEDCLARAYLRLGRYEEAIAEFERVLLLSPNYPRAHFYIAEAYRAKGMIAEARENYARFLAAWRDADADVPEVIAAKNYVGS